MSLRKSTIAGLGWTFAQQFSTQGISFVVSIVLARILLPAEFGLVAMIGIFTNLGSALVEGGLSQSLIRTKYVGEKDFSTIFFFNITVSLIIYLILFVSAPWIAEFYKEERLTNIIRVYSLILLITGLSSVQMTRLTKNMEFKKQLTIAIPSLVLSGLLGVILAFYGFGVWSLIYMGLFQALLSSGQLWIYAKWHPRIKYFSKKRLKYHFRFGINLTFVTIIHTLYINIYSLIIGKYFSANTLGYYTRANSLKDVFVNNISNALNKVLYPTFAQIQDDNERLKRAYRRVMTQVFFWVAPILLFAVIFAEPLIRFILTEKWLPTVPYFQILCFIGILTPVQTYNANILKIKGRSDLFLKLEYIKKGIFLVGILISLNFGIYGLLLNQVFSSLVGLYINSYYSGRLINYPLSEQLTNLLTIIITSVVTSVLLFGIYVGLTNEFKIPDIILLVAGFITYFSVYFLVSHLLKTEALIDFRSIVFNRNK